MRFHSILTIPGASLLLVSSVCAAPVGNAFYGDPPDETHPWAIHDRNRPQPPVVAPKPVSELEEAAKAPAGAVILFGGTEACLQKWESDKGEPTKWIVKDGAMECVPKAGYIRTKEEFADCQLHVEWCAPTPPEGESQGRGNSGIFPMGQVECQVLDNFDNPTYPDGFACSVYGVAPPLANALRPPGEWQYIDITFHRPVYEGETCVRPGWMTVYCNGILVQDRTDIEGGGGHKRRSKPHPFPEKGPLKLQDHGNPVRFRNIWYRPLAPAMPEGGLNGPLSPEATAAKRKEIAASIRADAAQITAPMEQCYRLAESLCYEHDAAAFAKVQDMTGRYIAEVKALPVGQLVAKKDEVKRLYDVLGYLAQWKIVPGDFGPKADIDAIVKAQGWDKKKR